MNLTYLEESQDVPVLSIAGIKLKSLPDLLEDTSISNPELRADQVFLFGEKGDSERGAI